VRGILIAYNLVFPPLINLLVYVGFILKTPSISLSLLFVLFEGP